MDGNRTLKAPTFFVSQEDTSFKTEYFPQSGEAERRIHFFAQSLTTPMPPPHPVECMPTFTVLTVSTYFLVVLSIYPAKYKQNVASLRRKNPAQSSRNYQRRRHKHSSDTVGILETTACC